MYLASQSLREFISQIFCYPNSSSQDEAIAARVRVEQINAIKRYLTWILVANVCNALILVAALWTSTLHPLAAAWAAAVIVLCFYLRRVRKMRLSLLMAPLSSDMRLSELFVQPPR